ncbi:hypothetical protein LTR20_006026 [Exophiala xenobiotica]|nr:hypothetical protein LTS13_003005 [Exophiala xenobiotica]KAK5396000.1 hypothetical protein LTR79_006754 [Exophiala xenobiotica]KAK5423953.1 hypothetical protein LTR90_001299 [Exophiala xenobiotica]KAK5462077.1 hypothetical protein LTR20_006026 [Exophiala xenobiotica]KAK5479755.1 hypothetical protein LTR26_007608 [Exophiala xenobiotica]
MSDPRRPSDAPVNLKDPRLRRAASHNTGETVSSPATEKRDPFGAREGTSSGANTPQRSDVSLENTLQPTVDPADREKSLITLLSNATDSRLLARDREHLEKKVKKARAEQERVQRTHAQFPLMVHQSAQNLKKVEACYKAAQQQADQHVAAERASVRDFLRLFVDQSVKESSGHEALLAENNDLRRQFQSIQSQHSSQLEVTEKTANELAKVIAENDDLKKRLLNQERSLNTLGQEIISLQDSQKRSIKNVEQSVTTLRQDMRDISKTAEKFLEFESFRKSSQLKAKDTQGALEAVDERVLSIEKTVSVMGTVKNELDSLKKSNEAQSGRIKNLLENLTTQRAETKALGTSVDQLSTTQRAEIKALGINIDQLSESLNNHKATTLATLAQQTDDRLAQNNEIQRIENESSAKVASLQRVLTESEQASKATDKVPAGAEKAGALTSKIEELEKQQKKVQKLLEALQHNFQWLDHRFNNLHTVELHRRITTYLAPVLPKFDQGLIDLAKTEQDIKQLRSQLDTQTADDNGSLQDRDAEQLRSDYDALTKQFQESRDKLILNINELQHTQLRSGNEASKLRENTESKLKEFENQINDLRRSVKRSLSAKRSTPDSDRLGFSIKGRSQAPLSERRTPTTSERRLQVTRRTEDVESADELNSEVSQQEQERLGMLAKFKRPATTSVHNSVDDEPLIKSPARVPDRQPGKRKRSEREDPKDMAVAESEPEDVPPPRRRTRKWEESA